MNLKYAGEKYRAFNFDNLRGGPVRKNLETAFERDLNRLKAGISRVEIVTPDEEGFCLVVRPLWGESEEDRDSIVGEEIAEEDEGRYALLNGQAVKFDRIANSLGG